jgi:hypothetical protein
MTPLIATTESYSPPPKEIRQYYNVVELHAQIRNPWSVMNYDAASTSQKKFLLFIFVIYPLDE